MAPGGIEIGIGVLCLAGGFLLVLRGIGDGGSASGWTVEFLGVRLQLERVGPGITFAVLGVVLIVLGSNSPLVSSSQQVGPPGQQVELIQGRGFYLDVKDKTKSGVVSYPAYEDVSLSSFPLPGGAALLKGSSNGSVETGLPDNHVENKSWSEIGYKVDEFIYLAYYTIKSDNKSLHQGSGVYMLHNEGNDIYAGRLLFYDAGRHISVDCPYVLSTATSAAGMSLETAMNAWKNTYLSRGCEETGWSQSKNGSP